MSRGEHPFPVNAFFTIEKPRDLSYPACVEVYVSDDVRSPEAKTPTDRPGDLIGGRYTLVRPLGAGGMAIVWLAKHPSGAPVALKRLKPEFATEDGRRLFEEEARISSKFSHPNLCACLDFGVDEDGRYFMAMEYVEGIDLDRFIVGCAERKALTSWSTVTVVVREVLRGLSAVHTSTQRLIVHRDVSPNNIRLVSTGGVKLLDFGVALSSDRERVTPAHVFKGKVGYSAPEIALGEQASVLSDVYACGVVLWESLAMRRLFGADHPMRALALARSAEVPPIGQIRPDLPRSLSEVIRRSLSPLPADRYPSALAMAEALTDVLESSEVRVDWQHIVAQVQPLSEAPVAATDHGRSEVPSPKPSASPPPLPKKRKAFRRFAAPRARRRIVVSGSSKRRQRLDETPTTRRIVFPSEPAPRPPRKDDTQSNRRAG